MTVKQLIQYLENLSPDAVVYVFDENDREWVRCQAPIEEDRYLRAVDAIAAEAGTKIEREKAHGVFIRRGARLSRRGKRK